MQRQQILAIVTLLAVAYFSANAQTAAVYDQPARLKLRGFAEPNDSSNLITESFYPIGWSEDGKFAYYVEPPDEACRCYFGTLVIQDLKTDKVLWKDKYSGDESEPVKKDETISDHWKARQKPFSEKLAEYGIKQQNKFTLNFPSLKYRKDLLTPKLDARVKSDGGFYASGTVTLKLVSKLMGEKIVYSEKYDPEVVSGFLGIDLAGVLVSPFEARGAIIVVEQVRGYEGPPHTTRIRIVGANLATGFSKK